MASVNNEDKAKIQNYDNAELSTPQQIKRSRDDGIDAISVSKIAKLMEHHSRRILQILDQKLARQTEIIAAKLNAQFEQRFAEFEDRLADKLGDLRIDMESVKIRLSVLESKDCHIETLKADVMDLRLVGVPFYAGKNLRSILNMICSSIRHAAPNIKEIFRIKNKHTANSAILVILFSTSEKFLLRL